jgi:hypothetical protein
MDDLTISGLIDYESQYADPLKGKATVTIGGNGVKWEVSRLIRPRGDSVAWGSMHTFGREVSSLHIFWWYMGPIELLGGFRLDCTSREAEKAVERARSFLPAEGWRSQWHSPDGGADFEEVWARQWPEGV